MKIVISEIYVFPKAPQSRRPWTRNTLPYIRHGIAKSKSKSAERGIDVGRDVTAACSTDSPGSEEGI